MNNVFFFFKSVKGSSDWKIVYALNHHEAQTKSSPGWIPKSHLDLLTLHFKVKGPKCEFSKHSEWLHHAPGLKSISLTHTLLHPLAMAVLMHTCPVTHRNEPVHIKNPDTAKGATTGSSNHPHSFDHPLMLRKYLQPMDKRKNKKKKDFWDWGWKVTC